MPATRDSGRTRKPKARQKAGPPTPAKIKRAAVQAQKTRQAQVKDTKAKTEFDRAKAHYATRQFREAYEAAYKGPKRGGVKRALIGPTDEQKRHEDIVHLLKKRPTLREGGQLSDPLARAVLGHRAHQAVREKKSAKRAQVVAPALTVLEQTTRPVYGIAGGAKAAIEGKSIPTAVARGVTLKDKVLFSDVLKTAGVPKGVAGPLGFGLDVLADPTTYVGFGAGTALKKTAQKAAQDASKKALAQGASKKTADRAGRAAAKKVLAKGTRPGVKMTFAGKRVGEVRAPKSVAKAGRAVRESGPYQALRHVNPDLRPPGVSKEMWERARHASRRERAQATAGEKASRNRAVAISRALKDRDSHDRITDAIESRDLSKLNPTERKVADALVEDYGRMFKTEKAARLITSSLRDHGYVPRRLMTELDPERGIKVRGKGTSEAKLASSKQRTENRARAEFRGDPEVDIYVPDVAIGRYLRGRESAMKVARAGTFKELQRIGRRYKGQALAPGQAIYRFHPREAPKEITGKELSKVVRQWERARGTGKKPSFSDGRYVVLPKSVVDRTLPKMPESVAEDVGRFWDQKLQGRLKTLLTVPNPQYHFTNLYGDLFNAYLGQNLPALARNLGTSVKLLREKARQEAAVKTLDKQINPSGKAVTIQGKEYTYEALIREAEQHGAVSQGFIGRDLPDVLEQQGKQVKQAVGQGKVASRSKTAQRVAKSRVGSKVTHPIETIRDVSQYREDAVRLATFLGARRRGMSPDEAAAYVSKHHFDYGDLASFERSVMRRVMPFWTFTARNTPLQAQSLVTKPGKYANLEKARQEAQRATEGVPEGFEGELEEYEQRGIPVPIPGITDKDRPLTLYPKLPAMDLNRLGTKGQLDSIISMVTPLLKAPVEQGLNYSFFFKGKIDQYAGAKDPKTGEEMVQLRAVPKWMANSPIKDVLGVRQFTVTQRINGQKVQKKAWGIPAKRLHLLTQPGPLASNALQFGTGVENPRGQSGKLRALGWLSGLKVSPYDKPKTKENALFDERTFLQNTADSMRKQSYPKPAYDKAGNRTPEYQQVLHRIGELEKEIGIRKGAKPKSFGDPKVDAALGKLRQGNKSKFNDPEIEAALEKLRGR